MLGMGQHRAGPGVGGDTHLEFGEQILQRSLGAHPGGGGGLRPRLHLGGQAFGNRAVHAAGHLLEDTLDGPGNEAIGVVSHLWSRA